MRILSEDFNIHRSEDADNIHVCIHYKNLKYGMIVPKADVQKVDYAIILGACHLINKDLRNQEKKHEDTFNYQCLEAKL